MVLRDLHNFLKIGNVVCFCEEPLESARYKGNEDSDCSGRYVAEAMRDILRHDEHSPLRCAERAISANDLIFALDDVKDLVCGPVEMKRRTALRWTYLFDDGISAMRMIASHLADDLVADDVPCPTSTDGSDNWSWC